MNITRASKVLKQSCGELRAFCNKLLLSRSRFYLDQKLHRTSIALDSRIFLSLPFRCRIRNSLSIKIPNLRHYALVFILKLTCLWFAFRQRTEFFTFKGLVPRAMTALVSISAIFFLTSLKI